MRVCMRAPMCTVPEPEIMVRHLAFFLSMSEHVLGIFCTVLSNQKQPSCKKRSAALEKAMVKKDVKSKVAAKKWL